MFWYKHHVCKIVNPEICEVYEKVHRRKLGIGIRNWTNKCKYCDKGFFQSKKVQKGMRWLTLGKGKKVYRCPICKACFAKASELKRHIGPQICCVPCARNERTHTSEKFEQKCQRSKILVIHYQCPSIPAIFERTLSLQWR